MLYPSRRATAQDVTSFMVNCQHAQEDYFDTVGKTRVSWTDELKEAVNTGNSRVWVCRDPTSLSPTAIPYGGMIMALHAWGKDGVIIAGIATRRNLSREVRLDVGTSLLIGGIPELWANRITKGRGHIEASNDILLETFRRIDDACRTIQPWGYNKSLEASVFRGVAGWMVTVEPIDTRCQAALYASLGP